VDLDVVFIQESSMEVAVDLYFFVAIVSYRSDKGTILDEIHSTVTVYLDNPLDRILHYSLLDDSEVVFVLEYRKV
jgi:hypothetical protein